MTNCWWMFGSRYRWKFYWWLLCNFSRGGGERNWRGDRNLFRHLHRRKLIRKLLCTLSTFVERSEFQRTPLLLFLYFPVCHILILNRILPRDEFRSPKFPVAVIFFYHIFIHIGVRTWNTFKNFLHSDCSKFSLRYVTKKLFFLH